MGGGCGNHSFATSTRAQHRATNSLPRLRRRGTTLDSRRNVVRTRPSPVSLQSSFRGRFYNIQFVPGSTRQHPLACVQSRGLRRSTWGLDECRVAGAAQPNASWLFPFAGAAALDWEFEQWPGKRVVGRPYPWRFRERRTSAFHDGQFADSNRGASQASPARICGCSHSAVAGENVVACAARFARRHRTLFFPAGCFVCRIAIQRMVWFPQGRSPVGTGPRVWLSRSASASPRDRARTESSHIFCDSTHWRGNRLGRVCDHESIIVLETTLPGNRLQFGRLRDSSPRTIDRIVDLHSVGARRRLVGDRVVDWAASGSITLPVPERLHNAGRGDGRELVSVRCKNPRLGTASACRNYLSQLFCLRSRHLAGHFNCAVARARRADRLRIYFN